MATKINYQQIFEEEVNHTIRGSLELPERFYELSHQHRLLIEDLVDIGYRRAIEDALDPEMLADTAALAGEMGSQLYNFANMVQTYLGAQEDRGDS